MHLRKTDVIARLGGDEFALLLPETAQESARVAITKLQNGLLEEMRQKEGPVTFGICVLTCSAAPDMADELLKIVDELMYTRQSVAARKQSDTRLTRANEQAFVEDLNARLQVGDELSMEY